MYFLYQKCLADTEGSCQPLCNLEDKQWTCVEGSRLAVQNTKYLSKQLCT